MCNNDFMHTQNTLLPYITTHWNYSVQTKLISVLLLKMNVDKIVIFFYKKVIKKVVVQRIFIFKYTLHILK